MTENATYTALFLNAGGEVFTLTVTSNNVLLGSTYGSGTYPAGSAVEIRAIPSPQGRFVRWDDGNTENPRTITMNGDLSLAAFFKGTSIGENGQLKLILFPNPAKHTIHIEGIEVNSELRIFNVLGELVKVVNAGPDDDIVVSDLAPGLYLIRCGNASLRFVKE